MKKISIFVIILFTISLTNAQETAEMVKKGFVIVSAGKNFDAMKKLAEKVSIQLNYKLDLRGLSEDKTLGLTISKEVCEEHGFEFPSYIPRGRYDDGEFVSIEYTNGYEGFTPGYYIIIVSAHDKGNTKLTDALKFVKKYYKSAYIKYADVYMGCIH